MRIIDIREKTVSIASPIANAYIDFSKMTCSVVAVVTDVVRDGKRVVGYGFNSNGRYGQGALMRDRFIDRVLEANPASLVDEANDNLDPFAIWKTLMTNEKPGGHGEPRLPSGGWGLTPSESYLLRNPAPRAGLGSGYWPSPTASRASAWLWNSC